MKLSLEQFSSPRPAWLGSRLAFSAPPFRPVKPLLPRRAPARPPYGNAGTCSANATRRPLPGWPSSWPRPRPPCPRSTAAQGPLAAAAATPGRRSSMGALHGTQHRPRPAAASCSSRAPLGPPAAWSVAAADKPPGHRILDARPEGILERRTSPLPAGTPAKPLRPQASDTVHQRSMHSGSFAQHA